MVWYFPREIHFRVSPTHDFLILPSFIYYTLRLFLCLHDACNFEVRIAKLNRAAMRVIGDEWNPISPNVKSWLPWSIKATFLTLPLGIQNENCPSYPLSSNCLNCDPSEDVTLLTLNCRWAWIIRLYGYCTLNDLSVRICVLAWQKGSRFIWICAGNLAYKRLAPLSYYHN